MTMTFTASLMHLDLTRTGYNTSQNPSTCESPAAAATSLASADATETAEGQSLMFETPHKVLRPAAVEAAPLGSTSRTAADGTDATSLSTGSHLAASTPRDSKIENRFKEAAVMDASPSTPLAVWAEREQEADDTRLAGGYTERPVGGPLDSAKPDKADDSARKDSRTFTPPRVDNFVTPTKGLPNFGVKLRSTRT